MVDGAYNMMCRGDVVQCLSVAYGATLVCVITMSVFVCAPVYVKCDPPRQVHVRGSVLHAALVDELQQ